MEAQRELNFEGILSGYNLEVINEYLISVLLEKNIYRKDEDVNEIKFYNSSKASNEFENSTEIEWLIYFNNKQYILNPKVEDEIYERVNEIVIGSIDICYELDLIEFNILSLPSENEKLNYLKEVYKIKWKELSGIEYLKFIGEDQISKIVKSYGFKNENTWKNYVIDFITHSSFYLKQHLQNRISFLEKEDALINSWANYIRLEHILSYCKEKISEIENKSTKKSIQNEGTLKDSLKMGVYEKLIHQLIKKGVVNKQKEIVFKGTGLTYKKIISAIGYSLTKNNLFVDKISAKTLCNLLSIEFNQTLSEQNYSYSKQTFENSYPKDPNLDLVRFINDF